MSQILSLSKPSRPGLASTKEVASSFPVSSKLVSSPMHSFFHRFPCSRGGDDSPGSTRCSRNLIPHQNKPVTLMDNLPQVAQDERVSDKSQHDPAGPLTCRLSNSTWASELDYFQDPVAARGTLAGAPGAFPPLVSSEMAAQLSVGGFDLCGNPLAGLTLWSTDGMPNVGLGMTNVQGFLQPDASTHADVHGRELPRNFPFFFLPETIEEQLMQGSRVSPEPPPDVCRPKQTELIIRSPGDHTENETRWTSSCAMSLRSSRKRGRDRETFDSFDMAVGPDTRFDHSQSATSAKAADAQHVNRPYPVMAFDPSMGSDCRSLDQTGLQHRYLCDQLGTGSMCESQQALVCLNRSQLADIKYETVNLGEYDMCEVSVSWHLPRLPASPDWPADAVPVRRVFGINAGMTLFNLHRIICISMGLSDDAQASAFNHVWVLPSNNTYGGGPLTKTRASGASRIKVTTDRGVEFRHSITVSLNSRSQVVATPESVLLYVLGCVQLHVQLVGVMRNRTKQNSLIWVPRCIANGTYGTAPPPGTDWNSSAEICSHIPSFHVDVHRINTQFIDTRFSKNTSFSRRTKMIRAEGIDEDILRCYSESIQEFWQDPDRVRDLSIRVTRQSTGGTKRRCLEGRKAQRALEHESRDETSHAQEHGTRCEDLVPVRDDHKPAPVSGQHHLASLSWHESPLSLQTFISIPHLDTPYESDLHGDATGVLRLPTCPSPDVSWPFSFSFGNDTNCFSPSALVSSPRAIDIRQSGSNDADVSHAVDGTKSSHSSNTGVTAIIQTPNHFAYAGVGSTHGVRRSKQIKEKGTQQQEGVSNRSPLNKSAHPVANVNELPLPLPASADSAKLLCASPSKTGSDLTRPSGSGISVEGSCCSTNPGDDIADIRLLAGFIDDAATRSLLVSSPEAIDSGNFTARPDDQGQGFDWPTSQQLWRSVEFVLTEDGGLTMDPRDAAQTAC
ncbi:hypothetical protein TGDOM2_239670 [Toxoplasma gondii GAB2-2007-GAL-DOM2]|uniref:Uncharacterized protein n=5 Tax=Toxoplasma gondii TaxID=5811 RepID=S7W017_TOXGG|nr:hypothetical protein TGGT1_239670 [Toxoplasma gondii GT1]KAF4643466.1 hypothetical protein TGRH88_031320 [Toxoplasma gondii]KFG39631.1 hypothetical protein TGDOM2_239670 [Toxoplasma gondii GAB2-2007-GAL-DOM2]KFG48338.1 hypothetical protein TGFOU_239670 [Toxoplasma gondii FOU]RQX70776.1 hypothetical protein TGCAST_239670 [Toxoplasma gondii CAST]